MTYVVSKDTVVGDFGCTHMRNNAGRRSEQRGACTRMPPAVDPLRPLRGRKIVYMGSHTTHHSLCQHNTMKRTLPSPMCTPHTVWAEGLRGAAAVRAKGATVVQPAHQWHIYSAATSCQRARQTYAMIGTRQHCRFTRLRVNMVREGQGAGRTLLRVIRASRNALFEKRVHTARWRIRCGAVLLVRGRVLKLQESLLSTTCQIEGGTSPDIVRNWHRWTRRGHGQQKAAGVNFHPPS